MKTLPESAPVRLFFAALALVALSGCDMFDDIETPHVFGGNEVPPAVMAEPRAVAAPTVDAKTLPWQRLGDVPLRPRDFTPQPMVDASKQEMEQDRTNADTQKQQYENEISQ